MSKRFAPHTLVLACFLVALLSSSLASAEMYYARGEFNGWTTDNPLTDMGNGHWQGTVTGLTPGNYYKFKLANATWSENWPASDARLQADATGQATFHLWLKPPTDGWGPTGTRVGYEPLEYDWEVMGSFNGWSSPILTLTHEGAGLYSGTTIISTPGTYEFKFRKTGDWGISVGSDFGNSAANLSMGTTVANQTVRFQLDLPNGRYKVTLVGAATVFDGVLDTGPAQEWDELLASALQDNYTGFGNQKTGPVLISGSELDALHVKAQGDRLYLGITGNLEPNGNTILVFFDTGAGGQNVLTGVSGIIPPPSAIPNMEGDTLDSGFAPGYVLTISTDTTACYADWYVLPGTGTPTHTYLGHVALNDGSNTLVDGTNPNGLTLAFDNTNVLGITAASAADAATATTGIEAGIPLADLGLSALPATIGVQVLLVGSGGYVSSQSLPAMPAGTTDLGNGTWYDGASDPAGTPIDFNTVPDPQYATILLTEGTWSGTLDGRDIPTDFSAADLTTLQANPTTWQDQNYVEGVIPGSELDQLLVKSNSGNLLIGIPGNLSPDGTNLAIFLDTKPGGETTLTDHGDRLSGNTGDTLPCPVDYAIVLNRANGRVYVDLYDLQTTEPPLNLGYIPDSGLLGGALIGGDPAGAEWFLGVNMTNLLGVSDQPLDDVDPDGAGPLESTQVQNARSATTGIELAVPLTHIGLPARPTVTTKVHLFAMLTGSGPFREISNQILPAGLGGSIAPFLVTGDVDVPTDLTNIDGAGKAYQCMEITLGHCNAPRFDADGDNDVDQDDFGAFQACFTGSNLHAPLSLDCECLDWNLTDSDGNIDEADLAAFLNCVSGPMVMANRSCDTPPQ